MVFVTSSLFRPLIPELRIFSPPESDRYLPRVFPVFPIPKVFHQSRTKPVMAKCVVYDTFVVARKPHVWHPPWKVDKKWKGTRILDPINPYTVLSKYCCIILRGPKIGRLSQMVSLSLSTVNCFENNSIRTNTPYFFFCFCFFLNFAMVKTIVKWRVLWNKRRVGQSQQWNEKEYFRLCSFFSVVIRILCSFWNKIGASGIHVANKWEKDSDCWPSGKVWTWTRVRDSGGAGGHPLLKEREEKTKYSFILCNRSCYTGAVAGRGRECGSPSFLRESLLAHRCSASRVQPNT